MRREIPPEQWAQALESFTLQHERWLVTIETDRTPEDPSALIDQPLEGITMHGENAAREIVITVGGSTRSHARVSVNDPVGLEIESEDGVDQAIRIKARPGSVTRVRLVNPMPPELVDGILRIAD
jgi:hypothetical protein